MNINTFKGGGGYRSRGGVFILEGGWALNRIITTLNKVSFWCRQLFLNTFLYEDLANNTFQLFEP